MKLVYKITLFALLMPVLFTACEKQNIDEIIPEEPTYEVDTINYNPYLRQISTFSTDTIFIDCVGIPYPVDFLLASGNTITVNSNAELDAATMQADSIVDFVYPFDAVVNNAVVQIEDVEDLVLAIVDCAFTPVTCADLEPHVLLFFNGLNIFTLNNYPYDINYPVTLIVQGNQVVLNNDDDYLPAVGGSPSNLLPTELVYPITITQFGRDIILNSDQDVCEFYDTLDEPCENKPTHIQFFFNEGNGRPLDCTYDINYPVEIISNGTTLQVQSRAEYRNELEASPNGYDDIEVVFPVSITKYRGGQQITFNEEADVCQFLNDCQ